MQIRHAGAVASRVDQHVAAAQVRVVDGDRRIGGGDRFRVRSGRTCKNTGHEHVRARTQARTSTAGEEEVARLILQRRSRDIDVRVRVRSDLRQAHREGVPRNRFDAHTVHGGHVGGSLDSEDARVLVVSHRDQARARSDVHIRLERSRGVSDFGIALEHRQAGETRRTRSQIACILVAVFGQFVLGGNQNEVRVNNRIRADIDIRFAVVPVDRARAGSDAECERIRIRRRIGFLRTRRS